MKKGHPPSLLSPETDGKLVRKQPSNNIPKIMLMIDDPVIDTPSCLIIIKDTCAAHTYNFNISIKINVPVKCSTK